MLKNAIDMHIHTAPDLVKRSVTDIEAARMAANAGMRAVMYKNHLSPTYARAAVAQEAEPRLRVFGSLVLNEQIGGINPSAVATACAMGAKCIWMPTTSAENHIAYYKSSAKPVTLFDDTGKPVAGLMAILEMIAKSDIILATGHISPEEIAALLPLARQAGVKKFVVTHPEHEVVDVPRDMQKKLAAGGAFFERCFFATNSSQKLPVESVADDIRAVGWETTVLSTDFGQETNEVPVRGIVTFLRELARCGIPENNLKTMITDHPAYLLGL